MIGGKQSELGTPSCRLSSCPVMSRFASYSITVAAAVAAFGSAAIAQTAVKAAKPTKPAPVEASLMVRESQNSVKDTIDKLAAAAEAKGARVVARVDHAKGAAAVGTPIKPSEVLIFGNPKLGTPPMLANPRVGLDLPLKVLAYEDAAGKVWVVYPKASSMQARYRLKGKDQDANFKAISDALDGLTTAAATK
jgi:uncharacterized protein (DUF302 family)